MITPKTVTDRAAVAAHYDDLDAFYRTIWGTQVHHGYWKTGKERVDEAVLNLTHLVAKEAGITAGVRVCDIGCGYGATANVFAREYGAIVTGITLSKKQYDFANSHTSRTAAVDFLLCDGLNNNLQRESFDSVVAVESSEHMQNKPALFAEAMRLLRPSGRLVVAAWLSRERPSYLETRYLLEPICLDGRLPSLASASEYLAMLSEAGFRETVFHDLTHSVQRTWSVCACRFATKLLTKPALRKQFFACGFSHRTFAKVLPRIWLAYKLGSMCYGVFSGIK
jgi:tocopherol O-methyltransferase